MKYQAKAPDPIPLTPDAFINNNDTAVYWLTGAGILINSHGTIILVDPVLSLESFDPPISEIEGTPQYVMPPLSVEDIKKLDAILYTHADTDHMGPITASKLKELMVPFHCTPYVKDKLIELGVSDQLIISHKKEDCFRIGNIKVQMTLAHHPWQLDFPEKNLYVYKIEDCCGFKFYTEDGVIWDPGDSRFLPEHLDNTDVDLIFMDFEDNSPKHHFGVEAALKIVNHLDKAYIIMFHWGTYYAPDKCWFAADPNDVRSRINHIERFLEPHPGEKIIVHHKT